jgi:predicted aspartyl protease
MRAIILAAAVLTIALAGCQPLQPQYPASGAAVGAGQQRMTTYSDDAPMPTSGLFSGPFQHVYEMCQQGFAQSCKLISDWKADWKTRFPASHDTTPPIVSGRSEIALHGEGGAFTVPVSINGAITLQFTIDSGAADVSIPADVVTTLIRTGTIDRSDFLGSRTYVLADGSKTPSTVFRLRSLRVGGREVQNVTASIAPVKGSLLLGQSFLRQFGSWSIDNRRGVLVLGD